MEDGWQEAAAHRMAQQMLAVLKDGSCVNTTFRGTHPLLHLLGLSELLFWFSE